MATRTYILSATDFKKLTPAHRNVDDELIKQSIIACQDMFIEPIVGSGILDDVKANIADLAAGTPDYTTLLEDYIHNAMLYWILAEITRPISYAYTNIGVQQKNSERSIPIEEEEIRRLENHYMSRAQFYGEKARKYLRENTSTYPLFDNPGNGYDVVHPNKRVYRTSIFLGGQRGKFANGYDTFNDPLDDCCE